MAASKLTGAPAWRRKGVGLQPAGLVAAWLMAYCGVWTATIATGVIVEIVGRPAMSITRRLLGLALTEQRNPPPHLGHVLALAGHNLPIVAWPVLIGITGADRRRLTRRLADCAVLMCVLLNTASVGAAFAAYGTSLIAYVPQLPLEWAGLALGASSWVVQRRRAASGVERVVWLALTAGVLLCAATVETALVPHR
jgi:hypothetical protein